MHSANDTIAAIATAPGEGGIAIVRLSGGDALRILCSAFSRKEGAMRPRTMVHGHMLDAQGAVLDEVLCVYFQAPHSYTREDVCEVHCHGGRIAVQAVLGALIARGARLAEPGEFTRRAFLSGRIDLSRAEAVMALIGAGSEASARAAVRQMVGGISQFVEQIAGEILAILSHIEAANDFPDEIDEEPVRGAVIAGIEGIIARLDAASNQRAARIVREGLSIVLCGAPNVGKSSLMNALLGQDRAIVTEVAGTTRDVLTERIRIGEYVAEISDTAGQRDSADAVEQIGVARAVQAQKSADVLLMVLDASRMMSIEDRAIVAQLDGRAIVVINKTDIAAPESNDIDALCADFPIVRVCARSGEGIDALRRLILSRIVPAAAAEEQMTVARHIACARDALSALSRAHDALAAGFPLDIASVDLREGLDLLLQITGRSAESALIAEIFGRFCVGK